jgi:hypothetical protein
MSEVVEELKAARELLDRGFIRHALVTPNEAGHCALGAVYLAHTGVEPHKVGTVEVLRSCEAARLLNSTAGLMYSRPIVYVNDRLGKKATLEVFDKAICLAENGITSKDVLLAGDLDRDQYLV